MRHDDGRTNARATISARIEFLIIGSLDWISTGINYIVCSIHNPWISIF